MSHDVSAHRDAALRRVGRNVVNFQRLELALKGLIPALNAKDTLGNFQSNIAKGSRQLKKKSLGELTETFHAEVVDASEPILTPIDSAQASLAFAFHLEVTPATAQMHKRMLLSLVRERNRLIHHELGPVDFDSIEECEQLSKKLDEQNYRICDSWTSLSRSAPLTLTPLQNSSDLSIPMSSSKHLPEKWVAPNPAFNRTRREAASFLVRRLWRRAG